MANISIIDTGKPNITDTGSVGSDQVNSGTAIELKAVNMNYRVGLNKDNSASPNSSTTPEINPVSFGSAKLTVNGMLDRRVTADMTNMVNLRDMAQSKGVKLIYYNSTTDGYRDITDSLGDANKDDAHKAANFSSTATAHLHCIIISFQINQTKNSNFLNYTFVMEETT
jgi:hypothetical protein